LQQKIEQIKNILNPPLIKLTEEDSEWIVDKSLTANLTAAIQDIESGVKDEVLLTTLRSVLEKLEQIESILDSRRTIVDYCGNYMISP